LGGAAGLYFLGLGTHNEHLAETGRLGAEAVIDSLLVVEALKLATNRERPNEGNGQGDSGLMERVPTNSTAHFLQDTRWRASRWRG
jgi:hypothetical protein